MKGLCSSQLDVDDQRPFVLMKAHRSSLAGLPGAQAMNVGLPSNSSSLLERQYHIMKLASPSQISPDLLGKGTRCSGRLDLILISPWGKGPIPRADKSRR